MAYKIPLADLRAQYLAFQDELDSATKTCLEQTSFIGGPDHEAFQQEFAEFCGDGHVALCGNGTDAITLALTELLGQGDGRSEVITVSHTFIATSEAIAQAGYRPVFVDVRPDTLLMNVDQIERALTPLTRAILPVHLYGQMVEMDRLVAIAQQHSLKVIEDAAQAHGATWMGKGPGHWGDAATYSFYPGKNLGAWGDAGAVFSRDEKVIQSIRQRLDHGRLSKYEHAVQGTNSRLDGLQAAILRVKLRHLVEWNHARKDVARRYDQLLGGHPAITLPVTLPEAEHVFHLYVIQVAERDRLMQTLKSNGIEAGVHYPLPLHEQPAYRFLAIKPEALPVTHSAARRVLSLPIYPEMTIEQSYQVCETLINAIGK